VREPIDPGLVALNERLPYCSSETRNNLKKFCDKKDVDVKDEPILFHMDFTITEMDVLCSILGYPDRDLETPQYLTKLLRTMCPTPRTMEALSSKVYAFYQLNKLLASAKTDFRSFFDTELRRKASTKLGSRAKKACRYLWAILKHAGDADESQPAKVQGRNEIMTTSDFQDLVLRSEARLDHLSEQLRSAKSLSCRTKGDLRKFFSDAVDGKLSQSPSILRGLPPSASVGNDASLGSDRFGTSTLLRTRELGYASHRQRASVKHALHETAKWELVKSWKGASNDVLVLSWSPDGTRFAAGAAAQSDSHNMQYNRNNNLLLGDLTSNRLKELPDHRIPRPASNTSNMSDSDLYMSISAVKWHGDRLYTASYDNTVKIWDVSTHSDAACIRTLPHIGKVQVMAKSDFETDLLATGCEDSATPFQLWRTWNVSEPLPTIARVDMTPSSLAWGSNEASKHFLAAGMSGSDSGEGDPPKTGHLALWQVCPAGVSSLNVMPNAQNIFDISWHPNWATFATGGSVSRMARTQGFGRSTRSLVRVYDAFRDGKTKTSRIVFQCPALDINDVTWCPANPNYITASCTDAVTYVWDCRRPDTILHQLRNGPSIQELDTSLSREQADVGARLTLWGKGATELYTGASDGHLNRWNILGATEDALTENIAVFGQEIMSGALSPDGNNMLIGDACGGIHILSNAPWSRSEDLSMNFEPAARASPSLNPQEEERSGILLAREHLLSGRLARHPEFGVGKGPNYDSVWECDSPRPYDSPWAPWARPDGTTDPARTPLIAEIQDQQFSGPPLQMRRGLNESSRLFVETQMDIAKARNSRREDLRRKRKASDSPPRAPVSPARAPSSRSLRSFHPPMAAPISPPRAPPSRDLRSPQAPVAAPAQRNSSFSVIDLTLDDDPPSRPRAQTAVKCAPRRRLSPMPRPSFLCKHKTGFARTTAAKPPKTAPEVINISSDEEEEEQSSQDESGPEWEDDYWFPAPIVDPRSASSDS
jgi:WD40 repeat protein